jgi:flagellar biosynthesis/type III secretory pathway chaperone
MYSIKKLVDVLRELKMDYKKYLEYAVEQKQALVHNDIDALNKVNISIEVVSVDLQNLDRQRVTLMETIAKEAGVEAINKVTDIKNYFPNNEYSGALEEIAAELKPIFEEVKNVNTINRGLIGTSRDYIKTTLAIATSVLNRNKKDSYKTYGSSGMVNQGSRQLRSLLNKEV